MAHRTANGLWEGPSKGGVFVKDRGRQQYQETPFFHIAQTRGDQLSPKALEMATFCLKIAILLLKWHVLCSMC